MAEGSGDLSGGIQDGAKGAAGVAGKGVGLAVGAALPEPVSKVLLIIGIAWAFIKKILLPIVLVMSMVIFLMFMALVEPPAASANGECTGPYSPTTDGKANPSVVSAIWGVLDAKGADDRVILATWETGLVESGLRNLANTTIAYSMSLPHDGTGSDHDSVGVFQQRASGNWGGGPPNSENNIKNEMTPAYAAQKFIETAMNKEKTTPGSAGALAQAVQVSAVPTAYDARQADAQAYIDSHTPAASSSATGTATGTGNLAAGSQGADAAAADAADAVSCTTGGATVLCSSNSSGCTVTVSPSTGPRAGTKYQVSLPVDANNNLTEAGKAVQAALGVVADKIPYESPGTSGFEAPTQASGMDCSGLTRYAVYVGTNGRIQLSHHAAQQTTENNVTLVSAKNITPGDLVETEGGAHIVMYIGNMKKGTDGTWTSTGDGSGIPMYAAEPYKPDTGPDRTADIGPLSNFSGDIVNYGHPNYK